MVNGRQDLHGPKGSMTQSFEMPASERVIGVLGPTNTGKTHYAIERMLAHRTGMIGRAHKVCLEFLPSAVPSG